MCGSAATGESPLRDTTEPCSNDLFWGLGRSARCVRSGQSSSGRVRFAPAPTPLPSFPVRSERQGSRRFQSADWQARLLCRPSWLCDLGQALPSAAPVPSSVKWGHGGVGNTSHDTESSQESVWRVGGAQQGPRCTRAQLGGARLHRARAETGFAGHTLPVTLTSQLFSPARSPAIHPPTMPHLGASDKLLPEFSFLSLP